MSTLTTAKTATTAAPLHPLLAERWSPRAFDAAHQLGADELTGLLEAARWAPSAANTQPWRFAVAQRGSDEYAALLDALMPGNKVWAAAASALIVAVAETAGPDGESRPWALYDTGQAVAHLTVQAEHQGLSVHQMGGFDREAVAGLVGGSAVLVPVVVLAVGRRDEPARLDGPLAEREVATRERLPLESLLLPLRRRQSAAA